MQQQQHQLQRGTGIVGATLLGLGSILGTGVYYGIPEFSGRFGTSMIPAIVVAALLATCNALSSAQLAARYPVSGGTYEYGYRLLNPWAGFAAGWLFLCAKSASAAAAVLQVTACLLPRPAPLPACGLVVAMSLIVLSGLRRSTRVNTLLVVATILGLMLFVASSFLLAASTDFGPTPAAVNDSVSTAGMTTEYQGDQGSELARFLKMAALMFVGFTGYGRVATLGEEIREPRRNIPIAVVTTLLVSAVLYVLVAAAVDRHVPLASENVTVVHLMEPFGSRAARFVAIGAVAAMLGVVLNLLLGLSRVVLAMARRHDLPHSLSLLNAGRTAPRQAVALVALIVIGLVLTHDSQATWSLSAVTVLAYYGLTHLAALRLPARHRRYPRWTALLGLTGCLLLAAHVDRPSIILAVSLLVAGLAGRAILRRRPAAA